jgi:secreted trypsin-like serine protease
MARRALLGLAVLALAVPSMCACAGAAQGGATTSVINGQEATAGTFPYMAFVVFSNSAEATACSGTVVSSNVVLTAAHCVMNETFSVLRNPANLQVTTGSVDWASPARSVSTVSRIAVDPNLAWTIPGYLPVRGDAAVLELSAPVAAPPLRVATTQLWNTGTGAVLVGWGRTTAFGPLPETLHVGEAGIQSPEYCKGKSPHFESAWVLCVQDYPNARYAVCHGDSGGPLLITGPAGEPLEIGITSYVSSEECSPSTPQYFTRADAVASFVSQKITEWAPPPVQPTAPTAPAPSTSTPKATPTPSPSPPATPTLPVMTRTQATTYATRALQLGLGGRFRGHSRYRVSCTGAPSSKQYCSVAWTLGSGSYWGTVTPYYLFEEGKVVWSDHYSVQTLIGCNPRCTRRTFKG